MNKAKVKKLGTIIRRERTKRGMTQRQLAEEIGTPQTYISKYELGGLIPRYEDFIALKKFLEVEEEFNQLLKGK